MDSILQRGLGKKAKSLNELYSMATAKEKELINQIFVLISGQSLSSLIIESKKTIAPISQAILPSTFRARKSL